MDFKNCIYQFPEIGKLHPTPENNLVCLSAGDTWFCPLSCETVADNIKFCSMIMWLKYML